jgi:putative alpha-1,2-mannosidase
MFSSVRVAGTQITASGAGATGEYVASARIGRTPLTRDWVTDDELRSSRTLTFVTSATPGEWGTSADAAPPVVG